MRQIDGDRLKQVFHKNIAGGEAYDDLIDMQPTVEVIPRAEYEQRLKADMIAMLTEIQLEIEEKATEICDDGWWLTYNDIIQQKINALKGDKNDSND